MALCLAPIAAAAQDQGAAKPAGDSNQDLAEVGRKLANPVSDVWALFTEFDFTFNGGDAPHGIEDEFAFSTLFEPVMPIKLTDSWKLITRPTIPIIWTSPVPTFASDGSIDFDRRFGLGDIALPLVPSPNAGLHFGGGELVGGLGPSFVFPTSTDDAFGNQKWEIGPAAVAVFKTKKTTTGVFPQYWWGVADRGSDRPDTSHGDFLYFFFYDLPEAWQIGINPTITFDAKAARGNKWNVPIGMTVAKTTRIGKMPVKFQLGVEYSVVAEDFYGKRGMIKLNIIPVIPDLIKNPLF
jgi:hypothetical protein